MVISKDGLHYSDGVELVENEIIVRYRRNDNSTANAQVYKLNGGADGSGIAYENASLFLADNQVMDVICEVTGYDAADNWDPLTATTDYKASTGADDVGTDLTAAWTFAYADTDKIAGKYRKVRVSSDSRTGYVTRLTLLADRRTLKDPQSITRGDTPSQDLYGVRRREIDSLFIDKGIQADITAVEVKNRRKNPKVQLELDFRPQNHYTQSHLMQRYVSDRIRVVYSTMGLDDEYFLEGYEWSISEGNRIEVTWQLQEA